MSYPKLPNVSKSRVDDAANIIARGKIKGKVSDVELTEAFDLVNAWRVAHSYPLNTFKVNLRDKVREYKGSVVAQRLKRMPTILDKLNREPTMQLTNMQDIGGVRAILGTNKQVKHIVKKYKQSDHHELVSEKDYITNPRGSDGYRSHHLVYKYDNNRVKEYNGLRIEIQLRTKLQHAWATAVETMGAILGQQLKSRQGEQEWLDFFAVVSSAFAHIEGTTLVPGYEKLSKEETFALVREKDQKLNALEKFLAFKVAMVNLPKTGVGRPKKGYYLLRLDRLKKTVAIRAYKVDQAELAGKEYQILEERSRKDENIDSVLVSVDHVDELKKAYPNYFLDVGEFAENLKKVIEHQR